MFETIELTQAQADSVVVFVVAFVVIVVSLIMIYIFSAIRAHRVQKAILHMKDDLELLKTHFLSEQSTPKDEQPVVRDSNGDII